MTSDEEILKQIKKLPEALRDDVLQYIEFLRNKYGPDINSSRKRKAGSSMEKYTLARDFDEPIAELKEYM